MDGTVRGEITLVIAGAKTQTEIWSDERVETLMREALSGGEPPAKIAKDLAAITGWPRRELYKKITAFTENNVF